MGRAAVGGERNDVDFGLDNMGRASREALEGSHQALKQRYERVENEGYRGWAELDDARAGNGNDIVMLELRTGRGGAVRELRGGGH